MFFFFITLSLNIPHFLWFDLSTLRIILLQSPTLGSEQARMHEEREECEEQKISSKLITRDLL